MITTRSALGAVLGSIQQRAIARVAAAVLVVLAVVAAVVAVALLDAGPLHNAAVAVALTLTMCVGLAMVARPRWGVYLLVVTLPPYFMILLLLYAGDVPSLTIRIAQASKEVIVGCALLGVLARFIVRPRRFHVCWVDRVVFLFLALNVAYMFVPSPLPLSQRASATSSNAFFFLAYFLGRSLVPEELEVRLLSIMLTILGAMTGIGAIIEKLFLSPHWLLRLGLTRFLIAYYNGVGVHDPNSLPFTFWTAGKVYRRVSVFYANPLDLAAAMLLVVPLTLGLSLVVAKRQRYLLWVCALLGVAAACLSLSRLALSALPVSCLLVYLCLRRGHSRRVPPRLLAGATLAGAAVVTAAASFAMTRYPWLRHYIVSTVTFRNPSSQGHLTAWLIGLKAIAHRPLGSGPGTSGILADRFTGTAVGGENQYIVYAVELGWAGGALYIAAVAAAFIRTWRLARSAAAPYVRLAGAIGLSATSGLAMLGVGSQIGIYLFPTLIGWWMIGWAVGLTEAGSGSKRITAPSATRPLEAP